MTNVLADPRLVASSAGHDHHDPAPPETKALPEPTDLTSPAGRLYDPLLSILASQVDDLERQRIASENRYRMLTGTDVDADGLRRGLGLPPEHRDVARIRASLDGLAALEHDAILQLQRHMRHSPWGPWLKTAPGVGEKQLARFLGAVGDPYWHTLAQRPRLVSELWAYCGWHTIPVTGGQRVNDSHSRPATGDGSSSPGGQGRGDTHSRTAAGGVHLAARRTRGQRSNWSEEARKRSWLIATSCVKAPSGTTYRAVYDATRAKYADAVHAAECVRCGPAGKPAPAGSPLPPAHQHARALRAVAKAVLRDVWLEARRLYGHDEVAP